MHIYRVFFLGFQNSLFTWAPASSDLLDIYDYRKKKKKKKKELEEEDDGIYANKDLWLVCEYTVRGALDPFASFNPPMKALLPNG